MKKIRLDHELAVAVVEWGWKYHHIGRPSDGVRATMILYHGAPVEFRNKNGTDKNKRI
ncbi:MAG: hypothetical protein LBV74_21285 [Tannerella sp.]|jgi:hypothetical protein|nr:hypothetical protein [Tannerella sp.]